MKANLASRFSVSFAIILATALSSAAAFAADDDYEVGDTVGPKGPISVAGLEHGLELYDKDVADRCILGKLQIRTTINGAGDYGLVKLELFGEKDFMKKSGKLRTIRVPATAAPLMICIDIETPGEYALSSYHDEDADRKFDKKWNFKPKEPYGLSQNPVIKSLRLPKWSETKFDVPMSGANITINLVDPD